MNKTEIANDKTAAINLEKVFSAQKVQKLSAQIIFRQ
jgi:hypothetical protein